MQIMKLDHLRKIRDRAPFHPFAIHLTTGEVLHVSHPEHVSAPEEESELFVVWAERDWNLVEASQVARVSVRKNGTKPTIPRSRT